ncbi:hypothetical protein TR2A62_1575 [Thalassobium sp. R2A62]|nr:hypothetical protein TR2A62_1575 [Thalassobium sp. R2A62]
MAKTETNNRANQVFLAVTAKDLSAWSDFALVTFGLVGDEDAQSSGRSVFWFCFTFGVCKRPRP